MTLTDRPDTDRRPDTPGRGPTIPSFAVISGIHYVFWTSKLLNEDRQQRESAG